MRLLHLVLGLLLLSSAIMATSVTLRPVRDGYYTAWTASGCSGGDYRCVDETPPSTRDYLYATLTKKESTFQFSNLDTNVSIESVTLRYYAAQESFWDKTFKPMIRISGANYYGDTITVGTIYAWYSETWTANPATGMGWTLAEVNALEAGMQSIGAYAGGRVATIEAVVESY